MKSIYRLLDFSNFSNSSNFPNSKSLEPLTPYLDRTILIDFFAQIKKPVDFNPKISSTGFKKTKIPLILYQ